MKLLKNYIVAIIVLSAIGCKQESVVLPIEEKIPESPVQVTVDMVVPKDDIFEVFYLSDGVGTIGSKHVRVNVLGKPESQLIIFNLPQDTHISDVRLDVGQNPEQEEMTLNKMTIKQHDKKMEINPEQFFKYFSHTDHIQATPEKHTFKGVELFDDSYDPLFYSNPNLKEGLKIFAVSDSLKIKTTP